MADREGLCRQLKAERRRADALAGEVLRGGGADHQRLARLLLRRDVRDPN
jgi:hypothetical protein